MLHMPQRAQAGWQAKACQLMHCTHCGNAHKKGSQPLPGMAFSAGDELL